MNKNGTLHPHPAYQHEPVAQMNLRSHLPIARVISASGVSTHSSTGGTLTREETLESRLDER